MTATTAAHRSNDAESFDHSIIDGLAGIMTENALKSLLTDMVSDASQRVERLAEVQVALSSLKLIEHDAHDLKSMGGNFGLTGLSQRAGIIERAARAGDIESVKAEMPTLIDTSRKSIATLVQKHKINAARAS